MYDFAPSGLRAKPLLSRGLKGFARRLAVERLVQRDLRAMIGILSSAGRLALITLAANLTFS